MTCILGLTGSMATGKSTILAMFAAAGVPVQSADDIVHELYKSEAVAPLETLFPGVSENGMINRQRLSAFLIADPENIQILEEVIHPLVYHKALAFIENCQKAASPMAVLEIPLLFETQNTYPLDGIAVTWCAPDIQRQRALARPGMSVEKFETMLARQMPQADKKARADFLINSGTSLDETRAAVAAIIADCTKTSTGTAS